MVGNRGKRQRVTAASSNDRGATVALKIRQMSPGNECSSADNSNAKWL
jgi:hypothetical protein